MAKQPTTSITLRLPVALVARADDQPGTRTEVMTRALTALLDGPKPADDGEWRQRAETAEAEVQRLQHEVARLSRDQRVATAKAALTGAQQMTIIGQRHGNPVLPATGLTVGGEARGFNLKGKR